MIMQAKTNNKPLISVIIPVHNTAKFLSKCLKSIVNQSFKDIEIICIDDASKDKSLNILQKYSSQDERIQVFANKTNIGAGATRNFGVKNACGKYIYFLDSDDWLEKDGLKKLADTLKKFGEVDIISFLHYNVNAATLIKREEPKVPESLTNKILDIYDTPECIQYLGYGMTKLIRKDFLIENKIEFNNDKCFEDVDHFLELTQKVKSILFINEKIFNYRVLRSGSIISKKDDYIEYLIKDTQKAEELSKDFPPKVRNELLKKLYATLAYTALIIYSNSKMTHSELKHIFEDCIDYNVLKENNMKYYLDMRRKITCGNETTFFLENFLRMRIKDFFPSFFSTYKNLKATIYKRFCS